LNTPTPAQSVTRDIVAKLWNLCNVLKDDGVTYHQYVTELTYLLFLKMAKEPGREGQLPEGYRWDDLERLPAPDRLNFYKTLLLHLGGHGAPLVQQIFANASSFIKKSTTLSLLVTEIDRLDWYSAREEEAFGELYEGLLEKNANEKKSGAGQYFTPRPLIDSMVAVMQPALEDVIQDPAAGTGGFLISASRYIRAHSDPDAWTEAQQRKYHRGTFYGMEFVQDTHRLALMNLMLHGLEPADTQSDIHEGTPPSPRQSIMDLLFQRLEPMVAQSGIHYGDSLSNEINDLPPATLILTNPPFGTKKGGGLPSRTDFLFPTSNKQLCFLQHAYRWLRHGGRAAIVLPDNVLFEGNVGKQVRADLMDKCTLHTILRLPTGIFYAQGVKTNVLFFTNGEDGTQGNTREVWVYDLRTNMPTFGKRTQLTRTHFAEFEAAFGDDPFGHPESLARRMDTGETGRFRSFSREWIASRGENLDISWLRDESEVDSASQPEPIDLAREAEQEIKAALEEIQAVISELGTEMSK